MQAVPQRVFQVGVPSVGMVRVAAPAEGDRVKLTSCSNRPLSTKGGVYAVTFLPTSPLGVCRRTRESSSFLVNFTLPASQCTRQGSWVRVVFC